MSDDALLDGIVLYLKSVMYPERKLERLIEMNPGIPKKVFEQARKKMRLANLRTDNQDSEVTRV